MYMKFFYIERCFIFIYRIDDGEKGH